MHLGITLAGMCMVRLGITLAGMFMVRLGTMLAGMFMGMCLCRFSRQ
jgi:hypothetical protein